MSLSARARTLSGVRLLIYEHAHEAVAEIGPVAGLGSVHMRGGFLERVVMASLGVSVVMTLGCDITPFPTTPTTPTPTPTVTPGPEPSPAQRDAALALFDAASAHAAVTTSPLTSGSPFADYGKVMRANGPCDFGQGSIQGSLDGGLPPTPGTFLPTGSHTYVVSFSNCLVDPGWGFGDTLELNGVASAAYNVAEWSNITATVSADSVRSKDTFRSGDVTAEGSAVWTKSSTTSTYTPAAGSRLVHNSTTSVATFGGGSYSTISTSGRLEQRFDNLKVAVNGTEYTLNGSLVEISGSRVTYTGEVRIINNGTLVARIYGDGSNNPSGSNKRVEVLVPLVPL